jgi:hypothetical protein
VSHGRAIERKGTRKSAITCEISDDNTGNDSAARIAAALFLAVHVGRHLKYPTHILSLRHREQFVFM